MGLRLKIHNNNIIIMIMCCKLQQAKPVDVIGSREVTPIPEDIAREGDMRWVSPGQVQAELEELSRASRKFLQVGGNQ